MAEILIIDTDDQHNQVVKQTLLSHQHRVELVTSIALAKAQLSQQTPQLIIMAVTLADGSGYDLMRSLQQQPATRDIPILFYISAESEQTFNVQKNWALHSGAHDVLSKPIQQQELLASLAKLALIKEPDPTVSTQSTQPATSIATASGSEIR